MDSVVSVDIWRNIMSMNLRDAIQVVNMACGRHPATPLIMLAKCQYEENGSKCEQEFPMLPQDYNLAIAHNHPHICPECRPKYHRRKKKGK
jgi:hypothetical protein